MAVLRLLTVVLLLPSLMVYAMDYNNLADVACGQTIKKQPRIAGGETALPGEFPWLVSIGIKAGHICGGTIVNKRFILTAAHCFCGRNGLKEKSLIRVTLGEYNLAEPEYPAAIVVGIKKIIVHENFTCGKYLNDVVLLEVSEPIEWSESVQPACLPLAEGYVGHSTFTGQSAIAAGWGWLGESPELIYKKSKVLQKVEVNVVEDQTCNDWYASQGKKTQLKRGQMCAGHEEGARDACGADSGGPLMLNDNGDRTMVIGIVSSGIGCARRRLPGIYTRISEFVPWIIEKAK
ncbi:acrosin-like [Phymastichus coffea]|uniref:acrosin-like n=1 Tax=Phymastichus coffea TaxID=108790 RepID=UPI00273C35A0|nr:acrosin-like [Phymastichus coffea]